MDFVLNGLKFNSPRRSVSAGFIDRECIVSKMDTKVKRKICFLLPRRRQDSPSYSYRRDICICLTFED